MSIVKYYLLFALKTALALIVLFAFIDLISLVSPAIAGYIKGFINSPIRSFYNPSATPTTS